MAVFEYKATDRVGKIVEGSLQADSEQAAVSQIQAQGLIPMEIKQSYSGAGGGRSLGLGKLFNRINVQDQLIFTQELMTLVNAGLPLDRCLTILYEITPKKAFKAVLADVIEGVEGGKSLADAMAPHPKFFPKLYVNMIKAGEAGGVLAPILSRLGEYLERIQELKSTVVSAMIYPLLLSGMGGVSIIILVTFVVPKFAVIFKGSPKSIPVPTQMLLAFCDVVTNYWWLVIGVLVGAFFMFNAYTKSETGRTNWDGLKLKLPIFGELIRRIETARFSRTLGTLIKSGVPILSALNIVREIVTNRIMAKSLSQVSFSLKEGEGISAPLVAEKLFPPLALHMIRVGEETGQLDEMLLKVADTYDLEIKNMVKRVISLLEPAMILVMAVVIGGVVISMLLGIFSINEMAF
ncbi:MAG: type II secretion system inner membrane protein GspF [Deltaproteobacteria bacterium]|nr:type II secretion system inner membrane protein GspF [Deltaproteobacteria bacterium]